MIFSIIFNLLIIFLILYFFGNFFGKKGAPLLACFNLFLCLFLAVYEFFEFLSSENNISFIFLGN